MNSAGSATSCASRIAGPMPRKPSTHLNLTGGRKKLACGIERSFISTKPSTSPSAPITIAMVAPTSTSGTRAGTAIALPCGLQVLAVLTYSTGAFGGAL